MRTWFSLVIAFLFVNFAAWSQTPSTDSQTLQSLLSEVRQLRHDLQAVTVTSQRVQIALYRLQAQEAVVTRVSQKYDEARLKLADAERAKKQMTTALQDLENQRAPNEDPNLRKALDARISEVKRSLEIWTSDEQQRQVRESEVLGQLRAEQAKLSELQTWLDKLDKMLDAIH